MTHQIATTSNNEVLQWRIGLIRSSRLLNTKPQDDELKAPSPSRKRHTSKEGNCWIVPPLRGDSRGVCLAFLIILFFPILIFSG